MWYLCKDTSNASLCSHRMAFYHDNLLLCTSTAHISGIIFSLLHQRDITFQLCPTRSRPVFRQYVFFMLKSNLLKFARCYTQAGSIVQFSTAAGTCFTCACSHPVCSGERGLKQQQQTSQVTTPTQAAAFCSQTNKKAGRQERRLCEGCRLPKFIQPGQPAGAVPQDFLCCFASSRFRSSGRSSRSFYLDCSYFPA